MKVVKKEEKNPENEHITPGELCCLSYSCPIFFSFPLSSYFFHLLLSQTTRTSALDI
jgi:hypothetical protein